ncbi:MAG: DUF4174 domain-containing protein [Marinobacter sp.]|uniref:DUF4174 domain-containing protein n=1 Tax=Marinobacter sp. TaxID=50741 RepID=UPI00299F521C|nr:DUF4174 domain-containing protein [Marinobacter sp.]MDX1633788.1 DUF4174 domain-containing protein [Marinobacter sp.]
MNTNYLVTKRQIFLAVLVSLMTMTTHGADMDRLSDYQWQNRLILVQAASGGDDEIRTLRQARNEIDDRDTVWFVNTGSDLISNQETVSSSLANDIKDLLEESPSDNRVLLIGKDGGIKSRDPDLDLDAIFRRIDAMPMRIREMRSNRNSDSE